MSRATTSLHPAAVWLSAQVAAGARLTSDSRSITPGDVFIAYPGRRFDARTYIGDAIAQGAVAVLWDDAAGFNWNAAWTVPQRAERDLKLACGRIAADWYGRPSTHLRSVGITGTSGKSSSALWVAQAFSALDKPGAVVGTLGVGFPDALHDTGLTTPDPVDLQARLRSLVQAGAEALAMEVSSEGLMEGRVNGMHFDVALFTNLSRDHLNYHGTMQAYEAAKARLFAWEGLEAAVINLDDPAGARMAGVAAAHGARVLTFTVQHDANSEVRAVLRADLSADLCPDLCARRLSFDADGMRWDIEGDFGTRSFATSLIGTYNVSNLMGVLGVMLVSGVAIGDALQAMTRLSPAEGRLQRIASDRGPMVLVDYAHKPDALEKALSACRPLARAREGQLVALFGCGGDRDPGKRPIMGDIAWRLADRVVVTSDNPRSESPRTIVDAILAGMPDMDDSRVQVEVDRRVAIHAAITAADGRDVILIAGKGHEKYQDIGGVKLPFSDAEEAAKALHHLPETAAC